MTDDTRRCKAQTYINTHPVTNWVAHPMGINEPELLMLPSEVLHSLACCDDDVVPPEPEGTLMFVNTNQLNVRTSPNTSNEPVGQLIRNEEVYVNDGSPWCVITSHPNPLYVGKYLFRELLRPS